MEPHGYFLRSRGVPPTEPALAAATSSFTLSAEDHDILLRTGLDRHVGILSSQPPRKKVKATEAEVVMVYSDCDLFGSSDLTELDDSDGPARPTRTSTGKRKRRRKRKQETLDKQIRSGRVRLAHKAVASAQMMVNTVQLQNFRMEKAVEYIMYRDPNRVVVEETVETRLDGDTAQQVVSADGYDVLYRIPRACKGKSLRYVSNICDSWGNLVKIKKSVANDKKGRYKRRQGGLAGTTRLCTLWHAIGHKCDDPTPASDILHSGETFRAAVDTICGLDMVSAYVMAALERIDPHQHGLLQQLWQKTCEKENVQKLFDSINGGLAYEGREVVFNRVSGLHWDQHDPHWSWLNVTVTLHPGDMVFFRGRDLCHEAPDWGSGTRNFLVHFTHQHMWDHMQMTCASGKAVLAPS